MMKRLIVACIVCGTFSNSVVCQQPTRLQVFSTSERSKADEISKRIDEMGYGPSKVDASAGLYKVLTKSYGSMAEANFAKPNLTNAGFGGAFAVCDSEALSANRGTPLTIVKSGAFQQLRQELKLEQVERKYPRISPMQEASDDNSLSEDDLFAKAMGYWKKSHIQPALNSYRTFLVRFPHSHRIGEVRMMEAYWHLTAGNQEAAQHSFENIRKDYVGKPEAGEATLRLAYMELRNDNDIKALDLFRSIAEGRIVASEYHRAEALLRLAALYHRGKDLAAAEAAYEHISSVSLDDEVKAYAEMQIAGLILEQAWNGKRTFEEARMRCDSIKSEFPAVAQSTLATAALMSLETLCYEKKYDEALRRKHLLAEFQDTEEVTLLKYWIAKANIESGNVEAGLKLLNSLTPDTEKTEKRFKDINLFHEVEILKSVASQRM